jgi:hypothetical protein
MALVWDTVSMSKKLLISLVAMLVLVFGAVGVGLAIYLTDDTSDVQTAADCTSVEQFDETTNECYYECDTDAECAAIEQRIDAELNQLFENTTTKASNHTKPDTQQVQSLEASSGTYTYSDGDFTPTGMSQDEKKYASIFLTIATKEFANLYLQQITFFNDPNDDVSASVAQNEDNPIKWNLEINMAFSDDENEMIMTLVHEYAHIFSLNTKQVDGTVSGSCPALQIAEGCAKPTGLINSFQTEFWQGLGASPENEEFGAFYQGRESDFVSEYAGTNVIEDFAETFSYATLKDTSQYRDGAASKISWMGRNAETNTRIQEIKRALAGNLRARKIIQ